MKAVVPFIGAGFTILLGSFHLPARADAIGIESASLNETSILENTKPFADVPRSHWAYQAAASLQSCGIITGYPHGYFDSKRTLTRYEFAVALKRALDRFISDSPTKGTDVEARPDNSVTVEQLLHLQELTREFASDLADLGTNVKQTRAHLDRLVHQLASSRRSDEQNLSRNGNGFNFSSPASNLFSRADEHAASTFNLSNSRFTSPFHWSSNQFGLSSLLASNRSVESQLPSAYPTGDLLHTGLLTQSALDPTDPATPSGLNISIPVSQSSMIGVGVHDSTPFWNPTLNSPFHSSVQSYATNFQLRPSSRLTLNAEATRNILHNGPNIDNSVSTDNAFGLNVGYASGRANATIGFQLIDSLLSTPDHINLFASGYNLTDIQGPYTRLSWRFNDKLQSYIGGGYYGADLTHGTTSNVSASGFSSSNIYQGTAGLRWNPSRRISFSADLAGIYYDLSGALSPVGRRSPIEQYLTLGAGLNLSRSAVLKLAYQIVNQPDSGSLLGDPSHTSNSSVFTTEFAVHF